MNKGGEIWRGIGSLALACLAMLGLLAPARAVAVPVAPALACHAEADAATGWAAVRAPDKRWTCGAGGWMLGRSGIDLLFRLDPARASDPPRSVVTQASRVGGVSVWTLDADGTARGAHYRLDQLLRPAAGPFMVVPLPPVSARTVYVLVRFERPWSKVTASEAVLDTDPEGTGWTIRRVAMMAMICGLLVVPLLLNGAFHRVLRERFVLYHMILTGGMLLQVAIGSGFLRLLTPVTPALESPLSNACFAIAGSAGLMFAADFIEEGRINDRLRQALRLAAPLVLGVGLSTAMPWEMLRQTAALVMHLDMIPVMALIGCAAIAGCRNGSTSAWFLAAGWAPALFVGLWKVASYLLPDLHPLDALVTFHLGLAAHVLITTFGIIYRMVGLRRERDVANARAVELESVAGRDALTGLRNRHSIERRFYDLFRLGFRTMAVIDLDHFKAVNDEHGHAVGDVVLKAAAQALREDADTRAIRLGGEEFLLLLRGPDSAERAERSRRAISARIAAAVPGLDRVVTASMGMVEHDTEGALQIEFEALYAHCDRLLYEAKRLGRNRTMRERVTTFSPAQARGARG